MPYKEIDKELFYNKDCRDQVDKKWLKFFVIGNDENETSTRKGSEISQSESQEREYSPNLNRELPFLQDWI